MDENCKRLLIQLHSWRDETPHILGILLSEKPGPELEALLELCRNHVLG